MDGVGYLATGFALIWLILSCYLFWLGRRQATLQRRLDRLHTACGPANDAVPRLPDPQ
jgi:CcmD family protein